jgi:predicted HAD superfamily Cof-like phosphohydrolase
MQNPTPDYLATVAEFHKTFHHPVLPLPQIPDPSRVSLRLSLLAEELKELREAIDKNDLVEVADAFCDLQYVLSGAILEFGMAEKFPLLFAETHRSNLSKACSTEYEAQLSVEYYQKNNVECYYLKDVITGKYLVYRKGDNKTLKSINYSPSNLRDIL